MLKSKHVKAIKEYKAMKEAFCRLSSSMSKTDLEQWDKEADEADFHRGDNLKIYGINLEMGMFNSMLHSFPDINSGSDPSQISMRTKLKSQKEPEDSTVNWLLLGLEIEEGQ